MIPVDTGIPVPGLRGGSAALKYPWPRMVIGDSFMVRCEDDACCAAASARQYARYHGIPLRTVRRRVAGGYRIWRTA